MNDIKLIYQRQSALMILNLIFEDVQPIVFVQQVYSSDCLIVLPPTSQSSQSHVILLTPTVFGILAFLDL